MLICFHVEPFSPAALLRFFAFDAQLLHAFATRDTFADAYATRAAMRAAARFDFSPLCRFL